MSEACSTQATTEGRAGASEREHELVGAIWAAIALLDGIVASVSHEGARELAKTLLLDAVKGADTGEKTTDS